MNALDEPARAALPPPETAAWPKRALRAVTANPSVALSWLVLAIIVSWALVPWLYTGYSPIQGVPSEKMQAPSAAHWFGTDMLGRDLYARVVYGAVNSLAGAVLAVGIGLVLGTLLGVIAGSSRRIVDDIIMRFVDVLLAIPSLLLSLSIIILLGFGNLSVAVAAGFGAIAGFARLTRSEVVRVRRSDYVEAAFGSGGTFWAVLWRHVLPNSLTSVMAMSALQFGNAILAISAMGFLGYGAPPPTPEWGLLIAEGRNFLAFAWWLCTFPGLVVVVLVLAANRISQSIRGDR